LWEADRRDRPVRGLSSLFTMAPPFPYRRKDRTGIALSAVEDRHRYHRYHHFLGCPLLVGRYTRVLVLSLYSARIAAGYGKILVIAVTENEYGLEDPCPWSETCLQRVSVVRDAPERRMFVQSRYGGPLSQVALLDPLVAQPFAAGHPR